MARTNVFCSVSVRSGRTKRQNKPCAIDVIRSVLYLLSNVCLMYMAGRSAFNHITLQSRPLGQRAARVLRYRCHGSSCRIVHAQTGPIRPLHPLKGHHPGCCGAHQGADRPLVGRRIFRISRDQVAKARGDRLEAQAQPPRRRRRRPRPPRRPFVQLTRQWNAQQHVVQCS